MNEHTQPPAYYMKGLSRHIFWAVPVNIVLTLIANYIFEYSRISSVGILHTISIMMYICKIIPVYTVWIAIFLIYGIKNSVPAYKLAFFILACAKMCLAIGLSLFDYAYLVPASSYSIANSLIGISRVFASISGFTFIAGLIVIISNKQTGVMIRISSIVLASFGLVYALNGITFVLAVPLMRSYPNIWLSLKPIFSFLFRIAPIEGFFNNFVMTVLYLLILAFFFASISFSQRNRRRLRIQ